MPNTYTQLYIHFVFAVKYRNALILPSWKGELYKYITTIIQNYNHKVLIINGMPDHLHVLEGLKPTQSISDLMKEVKQFSSKWININNKTIGKFEWQEGFGAFSYSKSQLKNVFDYIENQEKHHNKKSFLEEYKEILEKFEVDFNIEYIFKEPS